MNVSTIPGDKVENIVATLHDAFIDYPVMRYVIGHCAEDFEARHRALVRLFVMGRVFNGDPMFAIGKADHLRAAATVTLPGSGAVSDELQAYRKKAWAGFGESAKTRYDSFCEACGMFDIELPHHHLNMVGVRSAFQGMGYGRQLVEHVVTLAENHPVSMGVSLSTEQSSNVPFYEGLGFKLTGHAIVGPGLETWNFFRAS